MVLCLTSRERCVSGKASILSVTSQIMKMVIIGKNNNKSGASSPMLFCLWMTTTQKSNFIPITAVTSWPKRSRQITTGVHSRLFFFLLPVPDLKKAQITATKSNLGPLACLVLRLWHAGTYLRSSSERDSSSTPPPPAPTTQRWTRRRSACHRLSRRSLSIPPVRIWIPSRCLPCLQLCGSFLSHDMRSVPLSCRRPGWRPSSQRIPGTEWMNEWMIIFQTCLQRNNNRIMPFTYNGKT